MRSQIVNLPVLSYLVKERDKAVITAKATKLSFHQPAFDSLAQAIISQNILSENEAKEYLNYYIQGIQDFPLLADLHYMLGITYGQIGNTKKANESLSQAAQLNPHYFWPAYNLGILYFKNKNYSNAIEWLTKAIQCPVDQSLKYTYSSRVFVQIFWPNYKIQDAPLKQNILNAYVKSYKLLSDSYLFLGKNQEAQAYLSKFQETQKNYPQLNPSAQQTNFIFF